MKPNAEFLLTTKQAAGLLEVHESSVKRWANEGRIRPATTQGGHRRIRLADLLQFARRDKMESALNRIAPFEQELALAALACRERNQFQPLADLIVKICDSKPSEYLVMVIRYLEQACEISLMRTFDQGVTQALRNIGNEWAAGTRSIAQERRSTQKIMDALYGLRKPMPDSERAGLPVALVGCAESCHHEAGSMFVRLMLERNGWEVCYLGADVPFDEYSAIQTEIGAKLVAISFVPPTVSADARRCLSILAGRYRDDSPYHLALGGSGINASALELKGWPFKGVRVEREIELFESWARIKAEEFFVSKQKKGKNAAPGMA